LFGVKSVPILDKNAGIITLHPLNVLMELPKLLRAINMVGAADMETEPNVHGELDLSVMNHHAVVAPDLCVLVDVAHVMLVPKIQYLAEVLLEEDAVATSLFKEC